MDVIQLCLAVISPHSPLSSAALLLNRDFSIFAKQANNGCSADLFMLVKRHYCREKYEREV